MRLAPAIVGAVSALAAAVALAAGVTLIWPRGPVDVIWSVRNDDTHAKMVALGWPAGAGLWVVAAVALATAVGSFRRRRWAWWLAVVALAVNGVSDLARIAMGEVVDGAIGVVIAAAILVWLTRPGVRGEFSR